MNDHKEACDCCIDIRRAEQELAHLQPEEEMATLEAAYHTRGERIESLLEENLRQLDEINALKSALYAGPDLQSPRA